MDLYLHNIKFATTICKQRLGQMENNPPLIATLLHRNIIKELAVGGKIDRRMTATGCISTPRRGRVLNEGKWNMMNLSVKLTELMSYMSVRDGCNSDQRGKSECFVLDVRTAQKVRQYVSGIVARIVIERLLSIRRWAIQLKGRVSYSCESEARRSDIGFVNCTW